MEDEHEQSPTFRRFALPALVFLVLTFIKAALFTAIVTAFVLDVMSDLEQSTTNSTAGTPPSGQPSSVLTVSTLWLLSIMSSLAATTWAILCLEWCTFLPDDVQAEHYEEMAEKRQRKLEAVKRWKVHLIVAAIPSFLHTSLFLFLAGLWLRLQDINKQLGLVVGIPSLIILSSYVVVTLLPVFTDAPFPTSASELIQPIFNRIMGIVEFYRHTRPPRIPTRTPISPKRSHYSPRPRIHRLIAFPKRIYRIFRQFIRALWKTITLVPIIPTFRSNRNPFKELNKLKVGRPVRDKGIYLRALFWLMNMPLSKVDVAAVLEELKNQGTTGKPLDRSVIRLLVLSLSSILEDNRISNAEQPIFDHCTTVLAEEMDRAFGDKEYNQGILFRNTAISEKLSPHFRLTASSEDALSRDNYWKRAIPALWLCPSTETIRCVVDQLDSTVQLMEVSQLRRIIRGLHAATISCFNPDQSTFELIPDFSLRSWDSGLSDRSLDKALSGFLQNLFAAFFTTLARSDQPTTTPSLIINCLQVLDEQLDHRTYAPKLHSALCFFVAVMQRSDPEVLEEGPSVARAFLKSVPSCWQLDGQDDSRRTSVLVARLRAIAYGPKSSISRESHSLKTLGDLYAELPNSIKTNLQCLEGFLDANAATLEATLAVGGHFVDSAWKGSPDYQIVRDICTDSSPTHTASFDFVRQHPNVKSRLPYLYSLAIALSYATEGRNRELWRVADLLVTHDSLPLIAIDRALDTNILLVTVLRFALSDQPETVEEERKGTFLKLLRNIVIGGDDWRTRWKSIYLIADLACLLSQTSDQDERDEEMKPLIDIASELLEEEELGCVPSDWEKKKEGLALCELETKVKGLVNERGETDKGVYDWSDRKNVPFLSLYGPRRTPTEPISNAAYWVLTMFHR